MPQRPSFFLGVKAEAITGLIQCEYETDSNNNLLFGLLCANVGLQAALTKMKGRSSAAKYHSWSHTMWSKLALEMRGYRLTLQKLRNYFYYKSQKSEATAEPVQKP